MKNWLLTSSGVVCLLVAIHLAMKNNDSITNQSQKTSTPAAATVPIKKTLATTGPISIEIPLSAGFAEDK